MSPAAGGEQGGRSEYGRELRGYLWGYGLAILLTLLPFGLVKWAVLPEYGLYLAIGVCALVQVIVHFRFFLHIDPPRQNVDDLHLILFTGLLLFFMVAGTIWILTSLAERVSPSQGTFHASSLPETQR
ncbi:MAG TPA: cytochrome C oxidase subunit IV family protein [Steroidobacteraceae bacterium]|nr:cytochrome C oxidase subunit IV family protein [Steroidobacteraceae bacterium]